MKTLKIVLSPLEPYFFGTDRNFAYDQKGSQRAAGYFIRSADTPSQTTLYGALRFMGIKNPRSDFFITDDDRNRIGKDSFDLLKAPDPHKNFGMIHGISPLYLSDASGNLYIKTPFDHKDMSPSEWREKMLTAEEQGEEFREVYRPFTYKTTQIETDSGWRCFPCDYDEKVGITDSWLRLNDLTVHTGIFGSDEHTGNEKQRAEGDDDKFFKKEFKFMKNHSFVFFATVEDAFSVYSERVFLGQSRSTFYVQSSVEQEPTINILRPGIKYAQSDIFIEDDNVQDFYKTCSLVITKVGTARSFKTDYGKSTHRERFKTSGPLIRLISAGSIFKPTDCKGFSGFIKNPHAERAGYNKIIESGGQQ